jgi:uncharacterized membrane protein
MKNKGTKFITSAAIIAALYVVLTMLANALGLANFAIQLRFSEALTILPVFTGAAIPGLFIGCLIANIISGCVIWDIVFGSLATLIGALGTYFLRKYKFLPFIPPIAANAVIVPFVLVYAYGIEGTWLFFMVTVAVGEILSCGVLGYFLRRGLEKYGKHIKWK